MTESIESAFSQGLLKGYAGGGEIIDIERAGIPGKGSHVEQDGFIYDDQWYANTNGGGQELIDIGGIRYTRLYGGGVPNDEVLNELGITVNDVGRYLKSMIIELGIQTRLFTDCTPAPNGEWQYLYAIMRKDDSIGIVTSEELITYKSVPVHIHTFILSPVR